MDASARNELASIKRELNSIISELESISSGVRNDFTGIGNDNVLRFLLRRLQARKLQLSSRKRKLRRVVLLLCGHLGKIGKQSD